MRIQRIPSDRYSARRGDIYAQGVMVVLMPAQFTFQRIARGIRTLQEIFVVLVKRRQQFAATRVVTLLPDAWLALGVQFDHLLPLPVGGGGEHLQGNLQRPLQPSVCDIAHRDATGVDAC
ncbi:hypothetical protein HDE76_003203 [Rhodanobacter sp. ANJX3]|uniref:hypothetical protein n=1 Tax=Rhodanobacter sp. ANJX3 TaxID=2723083 RepID=UPI0017C11B76|nr:hypothetical protein [Rhodanobacter sp. ANJX3]MBB5359963.1 hypothetical protein [Rhodanobacter sp. ANJX3]